MNCKDCGNKLLTIESRAVAYGVRRRHKCTSCGYRVTTVEIPMSEYKLLLDLVKTIKEAKEKLGDIYSALSRVELE